MSKFYITTAIVYTNAPPHIGFALELVQADAIARYRRMLGDEVFFLTGTDEHGTKIMRAAQKAGVPTQEFVDGIAAQVGQLAERLEISNTDFMRTSDQVRHWPAAQEIWRKLAENGDLYRRAYKGYYCVGHEAFIRESELKDGLCPDHQTKPEVIEEENWFFRLTKYKDRVRKLIESDGLRIVPERRKNELLNLIDDAEDVSFSRPATQLQWGVPVPDDPGQTMYVWADALTNYLSGLGYGSAPGGLEPKAFRDFWPADVHLVGKDIVRFHALIWPAMLMAAGLETPKNLYVHGFITVDGQKMSKSIGNVIDPKDLLDKWPADVIRYFMLRELQSTDDSDFSWKNLESRYNSDLANGLGNLVQRTAQLALNKLGEAGNIAISELDRGAAYEAVMDDSAYSGAFEQFRLHDAASEIWAKIGQANAYINEYEPWKKEGSEAAGVLKTVIAMLAHIAWLLQPFMPETAKKVFERFGLPVKAVFTDGQEFSVAAGEPLFPRK